jgi:hypothetical protein
MLTPEEQKQLDALLNKERETEVVEPLQAGNTTQTLAPKQTIEGTPNVNLSNAAPLPAGVKATGVVVFGQHYGANGLTREWKKK